MKWMQFHQQFYICNNTLFFIFYFFILLNWYPNAKVLIWSKYGYRTSMANLAQHCQIINCFLNEFLNLVNLFYRNFGLFSTNRIFFVFRKMIGFYGTSEEDFIFSELAMHVHFSNSEVIEFQKKNNFSFMRSSKIAQKPQSINQFKWSLMDI